MTEDEFSRVYEQLFANMVLCGYASAKVTEHGIEPVSMDEVARWLRENESSGV